MAGSIANLNAVFDRMAETNQGYSQGSGPTDGRWSFLDQAVLAVIAAAYSLVKALTAIIPGRAQDCSSGCLGGAKLAGYNANISGTAYTGNAAELLKAAGFTVLRYTVNNWRPGDFIVAPGHHIVYCRDNARWWSAESNEKGTALGGRPGNQNGIETRYRSPYDMTRDGTRVAYICRPPADAVVLSTTTPTTAQADLIVVDGDWGPKSNKRLQRFLGVPQTGVFDDVTKHKFQRFLDPALGIGAWGPRSTTAMQKRVGAYPDGDWGPKTSTKLQEWLNDEARKAAPGVSA